MSEWKTYHCTIPGSAGRAYGDAPSLSTVYHVVHLPAARRILEDGRLRAGLVYDESKLKDSRTCVTWLSANYWAHGSIYGNVQFAFDWDDIIRHRQLYWVEAMTNYSPSAYRFLLTDSNTKNLPVIPYNPETDEGPLRVRDDTWYWNDSFTSEFMLDADISLRQCTELDFVSHHPNICRADGSACKYMKDTYERTGGKVLAFLLGSDLHAADHALLSKTNGAVHLTRAAQSGVVGIWKALGAKSKLFCGGIKKSTSRCSVLRGALTLHGTGQCQAAKDLVSLLKCQDTFEHALVEIIEKHFGITDYKISD